MERIKFDYSYKNIPIPSVRSYKLLLIEKIELVIKRMRWKAHFYSKYEEAKEVPENYGFKSLNCPPQIKELSAFKNELFNLLNIINNPNFTNEQSKLHEQSKNKTYQPSEERSWQIKQIKIMTK